MLRGISLSFILIGLMTMTAAWAQVLPTPVKAMMPSAEVMRVEVKDAHVAAADAGGSVAVSMLLVNPTKTRLALVGASTPLAGQTVLQTYAKDKDGLVQAKPVNSLPLLPMSETVLAPGAIELQLVGLTSELQAGLELPMTLKFADSTQRVIRLKVEN
jgi:copper(I)-binding protein